MSNTEPGNMSQADQVRSASQARDNVSKELRKLKFEKKNRTMPRLPPNTTIQRRPLNHAPIASPYAGASTQKVVYVSRNTPIMSAVKRVKKLLTHVEKRATQDVDVTKNKNGTRKPAETGKRPGKSGESVLVKASGRAMEQALRIGEWFRIREDEMACKVEVRTGSVQVIDDIVENEENGEQAEEEREEDTTGISIEDSGFDQDGSLQQSSEKEEAQADQGTSEDTMDKQRTNSATETEPLKKRGRGKRKRPVYDKDELPESRLRWIKMVEVCISLRE